jgi:hypothetical protein
MLPFLLISLILFFGVHNYLYVHIRNLPSQLRPPLAGRPHAASGPASFFKGHTVCTQYVSFYVED